MNLTCKHTYELKLSGMCKVCSELKPYLVFRMCAKKCPADCNQCGYFWGSGHERLAGQPASWTK